MWVWHKWFTWIPLALAKDCLRALKTSPTTYAEQSHSWSSGILPLNCFCERNVNTLYTTQHGIRSLDHYHILFELYVFQSHDVKAKQKQSLDMYSSLFGPVVLIHND